MVLGIKERFLFNPVINFKIDAVKSSFKIIIAGMIFIVIYNRLSTIEFIGFLSALFTGIYLLQVRRMSKNENTFGISNIEKLKSERIIIRRLHKQAELDRERAKTELKIIEELKASYENKYMREIETLKIEYLKLDQMRTQTEIELQKAKKERDLAILSSRENHNKNTVSTKDYIKLQEENYRMEGLLSHTEQLLQSKTSELRYMKEQEANNMNMFADEAAKLQAEYLKVEELRKKTEDELAIANVERKRAKELLKKAEDEMMRINRWDNSLNNYDVHNSHNPYEILGVHPSDSVETIREIYKKLICIYHPDKHGNLNILSKKQKNDFMAKINSSYDIITKHQKVKFN